MKPAVVLAMQAINIIRRYDAVNASMILIDGVEVHKAQ